MNKKEFICLSSDEIIERQLELIHTIPFFEIEATNLCNLDCTFCTRNKLTRPLGKMDADTFSSIIESINPKSKVMFSGLGEPTLNSELSRFLFELTKQGNTVGITTHGTNLSTDMIKKICELDINFVQISIVSKKPEIYSKIMRKGNVDIVISNIDKLLENKRKKMIVRLSVIEGLDIPKDESLIAYAKSKGIPIFFKTIHSRGGNLYDPKMMQSKGICGMFCKIIFITWNGDVLACSQDMTGETKLGNITEDNIEIILERKKRVVKSGQWYDICNKCNDPYRYILFEDASDLE